MTLHTVFGLTALIGLVMVLAGFVTACFVESKGGTLVYRYGRTADTLANGMVLLGGPVGICITSLGCIGLMLLYY